MKMENLDTFVSKCVILRWTTTRWEIFLICFFNYKLFFLINYEISMIGRDKDISFLLNNFIMINDNIRCYVLLYYLWLMNVMYNFIIFLFFCKCILKHWKCPLMSSNGPCSVSLLWNQTELNQNCLYKTKPNQTLLNFQAIKPNHLGKGKPNYLNQNRLGES